MSWPEFRWIWNDDEPEPVPPSTEAVGVVEDAEALLENLDTPDRGVFVYNLRRSIERLRRKGRMP